MRKIDVRNFTLATRSTSQEVNQQIVLNLVREHQPISRADLARRMKVGRGMVTSIVSKLIEEGAVYEGETVDAPRGRKPRMLHIRTRDRLVVAVDVRFSRTFMMLGDFAGTPIATEEFDTVIEPAQLVQELATRVDRLLRTYGVDGNCEGIGMVVPGMVDQTTGRVLNAPQLGWRNVDIRDELAAATGLPVHIENAPVACAMAQMWLGQRGGDTSDLVYVTVSDGVGTGVIVNGQVIRGRNHTAGEFGHVPIERDGHHCLCGARGCWEAYTSNLATLSRYLGRELSAEQMREFLHESGLTIGELITRARTGDGQADAALRETGRHLGVGMSIIVNALNPARIFVGGEITAAWDLIEPEVRAAVEERALTPAAARTPIIPDLANGLARLRGATALVAAQMFAAPAVA